MIPSKSLATLEYDKIIARLAGLCETEAGRAQARALLPSPDYREVLHRQRLTAEARRLLEMKPGLSLAAARDVRSLAHQAALGHILAPAEFLDIHATLALARSLQETLRRLRVYVPLLAEAADAMADFRALTSEISRCINQRAEVVDGASPALAHLRHEARHAHDRLSHRLQQIIASPAVRAALQEPIITLRDGRYVIPVKAEMRGHIPGIVHDVSASGATVFLEPLEIVEMGNAWRELLAEEQREVQRVLRDLSARVGERAPEIIAAVDTIAGLDLALAKARLGEALGAKELPLPGLEQPWLLERPEAIRLVDARHPLLKGHVVPITVWAGKGEYGFTVLLITGPNTGGKTVALKTIGLLALMAQAGLPIPAAADSRLPLFDAIYADIGDEQSIEQSLSTFSSHLGNIIHILRSATRDSLVLLDELAAGTDPTEGAALAKAILSYLLRLGCLVFATTHHGELKAFAHSTPGLMNASVEFDPETLAPTYRLHIGLPGQSNALAIAQRLGMPPSVLEEARAGMGPDRLAVESLILELQRQREAAESARQSQEAAARAAAEAQRRAAQELATLEAHRQRLLERARRELETELATARARLRRVERELRRAHRLPAERRARALEAARTALERAAEPLWRLERRRRRGPLPPIEPGDLIYLPDVPFPGEAISAPDEQGELEVRLGALRARLHLREIERVEKRGASPPAPAARPQAPVPPPSAEVEVRGMTLDEALPLIDRRLDEAFRAGVTHLRIIHGKGTGTLRRAVREVLSKHPLVRSHTPAPPREGGDGVTVVELAG